MVQHNKQREEWHRLKEKNPRLAARVEAKAAGGVVESDADKTEDSSDDDDDDEVGLSLLSPENCPLCSLILLLSRKCCILAAG